MWLTKAVDALTAPWRLAQQLEGYQDGQNALLHEMLAVSRTQAEANTRMIQFLQDMHDATMVDGPPEGRSGFDDEAEFALDLTRRETTKRNES